MHSVETGNGVRVREGGLHLMARQKRRKMTLLSNLFREKESSAFVPQRIERKIPFSFAPEQVGNSFSQKKGRNICVGCPLSVPFIIPVGEGSETLCLGRPLHSKFGPLKINAYYLVKYLLISIKKVLVSLKILSVCMRAE